MISVRSTMQPGTAARVPKSKTENVNRSGHTQTFQPVSARADRHSKSKVFAGSHQPMTGKRGEQAWNDRG
jgi:hypothetical protein